MAPSATHLPVPTSPRSMLPKLPLNNSEPFSRKHIAVGVAIVVALVLFVVVFISVVAPSETIIENAKPKEECGARCTSSHVPWYEKCEWDECSVCSACTYDAHKDRPGNRDGEGYRSDEKQGDETTEEERGDRSNSSKTYDRVPRKERGGVCNPKCIDDRTWPWTVKCKYSQCSGCRSCGYDNPDEGSDAGDRGQGGGDSYGDGYHEDYGYEYRNDEGLGCNKLCMRKSWPWAQKCQYGECLGCRQCDHKAADKTSGNVHGSRAGNGTGEADVHGNDNQSLNTSANELGNRTSSATDGEHGSGYNDESDMAIPEGYAADSYGPHRDGRRRWSHYV